MDVTTDARVDIVDLTDRVEASIPMDVDAGICTISVRHTTAGLIVNEAEAGLLEDIQHWLETVVDLTEAYRHDRIDDNAAAHLRSILLGASVAVPVTAGSLDLGTWQRILLVESDGPRTRTVQVHLTAADRLE